MSLRVNNDYRGADSLKCTTWPEQRYRSPPLVSPSSLANSRVRPDVRTFGSSGVTLERGTAVRLGKCEERR